MTIECYDSECKFHSDDGPYCDERECRKYAVTCNTCGVSTDGSGEGLLVVADGRTLCAPCVEGEVGRMRKRMNRSETLVIVVLSIFISVLLSIMVVNTFGQEQQYVPGPRFYGDGTALTDIITPDNVRRFTIHDGKIFDPVTYELKGYYKDGKILGTDNAIKAYYSGGTISTTKFRPVLRYQDGRIYNWTTWRIKGYYQVRPGTGGKK